MDNDGFTVVVDEKKAKSDKRQQDKQSEQPTKKGQDNSSATNQPGTQNTQPKKTENTQTSAPAATEPARTKQQPSGESKAPPKKRGVEQEETEDTQEKKRKCPPNLTRKDIKFEGIVLEVINGDLLVIESKKSRNRGRFFLANVKAPFAGSKTKQAKEYGWEAKELVRRLTIGQEVTVQLEFERKVKPKEEQKTSEADGQKQTTATTKLVPGEEQIMQFCSITVGDKNVTQELLKHGWAELTEPIFQEETSKYYDLYKSSYRPVSQAQKYSFPRFNDLTTLDSKNAIRSKELFTTMKDIGQKFHCIVEAVINGSRFKLRIPEQNSLVWFVIEGIRCLPNDENFINFPKWSGKALEFTRDNMYQRDVEVSLASVDKKGVFHGTISVHQVDYAEKLLEEGLAVCFGRGAQIHYQNLEQAAREKKIGLWSEKELNIEGFRGDSGGAFEAKRAVQVLKGVRNVIVSEIPSADEIFVQDQNSNVLKGLMNDLANIQFTAEDRLVTPIKKNTPCVAVYSEDGKYYRAVVTNDQPNKNGQYRVFYTDFGNSQDLFEADLYKLPSQVAGIPPQAERCQLAYIRAPKQKTDFYKELKEELSYLVWDVQKKLVAHYLYKERGTPFVVLAYQGEGLQNSVNAQLIEGGFAQIDQGVDINQKFEQIFFEAQDIATEKQLGVWAVEQDDD